MPLLQAAGWPSKPHSIAKQRTITEGRIVLVVGGCVIMVRRKKGLLKSEACFL